MPTVTAVILNWNDAEATIRCARSVLRDFSPLLADGTGCDTCIIDNGSRPQDRDRLANWVAQREDHVVLLTSDTNLGFAGGMNIGIEHALSQGSDYIWLLNNDVVIEPGAAQILYACAEAHPHLAILGACMIDRDGSPGCAGLRYYPAFGYSRQARESEQDQSVSMTGEVTRRYVDGAAMWVRAELLRRTHGIPSSNFLFFEELALNRCLLAGEYIGWCREARIHHEGGKSFSEPALRQGAAFHAALAAFRYTATYHRRWLPLVILTRLAGITGRGAATFQPGLAIAVMRALFVFAKGNPDA